MNITVFYNFYLTLWPCSTVQLLHCREPVNADRPPSRHSISFGKGSIWMKHFGMELFIWNTLLGSRRPSALRVIAILRADYVSCVKVLHAAGECMCKQLKIHSSLVPKHVSQCQRLDELLLNSCAPDHVMCRGVITTGYWLSC